MHASPGNHTLPVGAFIKMNIIDIVIAERASVQRDGKSTRPPEAPMALARLEK